MTTPRERRQPHRRPAAGYFPGTRRLLCALACAFVALVSAAVWPASPAQAHNELKSSTPSVGAKLTAAPEQVSLVFNQRVEPGFSAVTLKVADSPPMTLTAREDGPSVTADVPSNARSAAAAGGSAVWTVDYRVVSADGHPINGSVAFAVANAARPPTTTPVPSGSATTSTPTASSAPGNTSAASGRTPTEDGQSPIPLLMLVGGGLAVAVAVAVGRNRAKPKQDPS